jgi:hypothetical protein
MLVIVSSITWSSPWIPFEIGYGHGAILNQYPSDNKTEFIRLAVLMMA